MKCNEYFCIEKFWYNTIIVKLVYYLLSNTAWLNSVPHKASNLGSLDCCGFMWYGWNNGWKNLINILILVSLYGMVVIMKENEMLIKKFLMKILTLAFLYIKVVVITVI